MPALLVCLRQCSIQQFVSGGRNRSKKRLLVGKVVVGGCMAHADSSGYASQAQPFQPLFGKDFQARRDQGLLEVPMVVGARSHKASIALMLTP